MNLRDVTEGFAVPGDDSMIDVRHPETGLSSVYGETLEQIQTRYPGAAIVNIDAFCAAKAERQRTPVKWKFCTEARYYEMLEVLPPALMERGGFLVGEPWDHEADTGQPRFAAFFQRPGRRFYESDRPLTRSEFREVLKPFQGAAA